MVELGDEPGRALSIPGKHPHTQSSEVDSVVGLRGCALERLNNPPCRSRRSVHPYEVAEVIALPVEQGNPPYLHWVHQVTESVSDSGPALP